jgi:hypothetical protein
MTRVRAKLAEARGAPKERVAAFLEECEDVIRQRGSHTDRVFLLFDRAELAHRRGDRAERDCRLAEAIELARRLGARARASFYEQRGSAWHAEDRSPSPR